jgi:hypothetical protein
MAFGTDLHFDEFLGGTYYEGVAAGASDSRIRKILWMYVFFHDNSI